MDTTPEVDSLHAVLVVGPRKVNAAEELVAAGRCGAHPGTAHFTPEHGWREGGHPGPSWVTALALWWDGSVVPEGWDRARRVMRGRGSTGSWVLASEVNPTVQQACTFAWGLVEMGIAERWVVLDLIDGVLVERPPSGCGVPGHVGATGAEGTSYCVTCESAHRARIDRELARARADRLAWAKRTP